MQRKLLSSPVLWLVLALFITAIIARSLPGPRTIDDAFITFRYSRNIVEGQGFVYNSGVHSLGTTTPLFTVLMALISTLTGQQDFQWYAIAVSALADGLTCVLLYLLARRLTGHDWLAIFPGLLWAVSPLSVTFAVGGMETSLNILWMVSATAAFVLLVPDRASVGAQDAAPLLQKGRPIMIGVLAGLGFLTRIDSLLWIGPLLLWQVLTPSSPALLPRVQRRREQSFSSDQTDDSQWERTRHASSLRNIMDRLPWQTWLTFGLVIAPWLVFSASYFGSPFPRSLSAKTVAYIMPPGSALVQFIQTYATPFFEDMTFGTGGLMLFALLYLALSVIGIVYVARRLPRLLPFVLYPWLYAMVFSIANPLIFRWYVAPPMPGLMLGLFAGVWAIVSNIRKRDVEIPQPSRLLPLVGVVGLAWVFTSINGWTLHPDHGLDRPAPQMAWHKIELLYEDVAMQLKDEYGVTPQTVVASGDIGAVGYFSRATILDTVGLVTPAVSSYYPVSPSIIPEGQNYAIPPQLILDNKPAFLVAMESMVRLGLEQDATFKADYELVREIPTDFYGKGMYVYARRGE